MTLSKENFLSLESSWDFLKNTKLPIFIYGMGDGALKVLRVFEEYRISYCGFFASDEFVRGHYFEGHKVHTLSEVENEVDEFVIVLAFACGYESLIERVVELSKKHTLIVPDVPVIGGGLFTKQYLSDSFDKIKEVYNLLCDEKSKEVFKSTLAYKITGRIEYLVGISTPPDEAYTNILKPDDNETFVDVGAYNGDTVSEFIENNNNKYDKIYALEPDKRNFKKLKKNTEGIENIEIFNYAGWNEDTTLIFSKNSGRQSMVAKQGVEIQARSVDSILNGRKATLIKYDVEGAEKEAITGSTNTIINFKPKLKIALYHRNEDIFEIPLLIKKMNSNYKLYMRKLPYIPAWELNLFCI